ncbi:O-antigen ligase family protein [Micrococcaceae bacterium Sec5.8]
MNTLRAATGPGRIFEGNFPDAPVPEPWARAGRLTNGTALIVLVLVLGLLLLTVQPWSRVDPAVGGDSSSSSALKGAALMLCVVALLLVLPPRAALRIPAPLALYLLYGTYVVISSAFQPDALQAMLRGTRLVLALMVPVLLWSVVRGRFQLIVYANTVAYAGLALTVVAGVFLSPQLAWQEGKPFQSARLVGAFLPMMAPRVGEIGAVLVGLTAILWAQRKIGLPALIPAIVVGTALVVFSHTRTAALALVLGLLVAFGAAMKSPAGRRGLALVGGSLALALPFLPGIIDWAMRGQDSEQLQKLSGRTAAWDFILSRPYDPQLFWFGHGLGDKRILLRRGQGDINVVPIDNSWLDSFWETGAVGAALVALAVLAASVYALRTPGYSARTFAGFLMTYVLVASVNESGLCDFSSMTLLVLVAVLISAVDRADKRDQSAVRQVRQPQISHRLRRSSTQPETI